MRGKPRRDGWAANNGTWRLLAGDIEIARLVVNGSNQPWLTATVIPAAEFDHYRSLFDDELVALDRLDADLPGHNAIYRRIREQLTFLHPDGRIVAEWLLHIDGDRAWWRWSMEPFSERR